MGCPQDCTLAAIAPPPPLSSYVCPLCIQSTHLHAPTIRRSKRQGFVRVVVPAAPRSVLGTPKLPAITCRYLPGLVACSSSHSMFFFLSQVFLTSPKIALASRLSPSNVPCPSLHAMPYLCFLSVSLSPCCRTVIYYCCYYLLLYLQLGPARAYLSHICPHTHACLSLIRFHPGPSGHT